ncbi:DUF4242 domain-containing protein [Mariniluteicoccus endophyticus]
MSSLFLVEIVPTATTDDGVRTVITAVGDAARTAGAELIESQVTADRGRVFAVVEAPAADALTSLALDGAAEVSEPAEVRLVGADLADIKAQRPEAEYLVEWDIPAEIDMDTYLSRKKAKSPLYANVPEVSFLRTYVREDMQKCLCFYDGPDTDAVVRAREAVSTPIDRLHALGHIDSLLESR